MNREDVQRAIDRAQAHGVRVQDWIVIDGQLQLRITHNACEGRGCLACGGWGTIWTDERGDTPGV